VLQFIGVAPLDVEQKLRLGRTYWERAQFLSQNLPQDYDFHYETMFRALINVGGAVVSALGYRPKGADSSHVTVLEVSSLALAVNDQDVAKLLHGISDRIRQQRRRVAYDQVGIITKAERDEFFGQADTILEALEIVASRRAQLRIPGHSWKA
jgi:hypothetical protein